ncbi:3-methyl-2-oxobutanoate hydroxymethyltransferase, partial [Clavibacter michiganensis]|uniref:3-methyl-2-oxobutanoate hydroxymethyltransferase n=1 Tax=Clavibacter michiganensis TaxID=28447 RepID=UPI00292F32EA
MQSPDAAVSPPDPARIPSEPDAGPRRVRIRHFARAKEQGLKITGLTSYDMLTAGVFDEGGIAFPPLGESPGNTPLGDDTTLPLTAGEPLPVGPAAAPPGAPALLVSDPPFASSRARPR